MNYKALVDKTLTAEIVPHSLQVYKEGVRIMIVHEDTLKGLNEILEYVKGDKSKARSMAVAIADEEIDEVRGNTEEYR